MSKKNPFMEPIVDAGLMEPETFIEPEILAPSGPGDDVFDFTNGPEGMNREGYIAYYRLAHIALTRNDASLMPNGKVMTRNQVETILGGEIGASEQGKCC